MKKHIIVPVLDNRMTMFYYDAGHKFANNIHEWNIENNIKIRIDKIPGNQHWFLSFKNETDAMAFKLRWM